MHSPRAPGGNNPWSWLNPKLAVTITAVSVATLIPLAGSELFLRWWDGYQLFSFRLAARAVAVPPQKEPSSPSPAASPPTDFTYFDAIPLAPGVSAEWSRHTPPAPPERSSPELLKLAAHARRVAAEHPYLLEQELPRVWNENFLRDNACGNSGNLFKRFPDELLAFTPEDDTIHPRYRQLPNQGPPLVPITNRFGWRGTDLANEKPEHTIRIGFLGSSSAMGNPYYPFSYSDFVGYWLKMWSAATGSDLKFEMINASRPGIDSQDIAVVARQEVLPLEPDLLIYYEGGNQFSPSSVARYPDGTKVTLSISNDLWSKLQRHSALLRRSGLLMERFAPGTEPPKPDYMISWPPQVDEFDPDLDQPNLPVNLSTILHDLDTIRQEAAASGAQLIPSSFVWLVREGMVIDRSRQQPLYNYLNRNWFPFRYRDLERLARFQNRVLEKFARRHGLPFIDLTARMPFAPELYDDAVHENYTGIRLHAWIVLQRLLPILKERLRDGTLPRRDRTRFTTHPVLDRPLRTVRFNCPPPPPPIAIALPTGQSDTNRLQITLPPVARGVGGTIPLTGVESVGNGYRIAITARVTQGVAVFRVVPATGAEQPAVNSSRLQPTADFVTRVIHWDDRHTPPGKLLVLNGEKSATHPGMVEIDSIRLQPHHRPGSHEINPVEIITVGEGIVLPQGG